LWRHHFNAAAIIVTYDLRNHTVANNDTEYAPVVM
jgi:hypothetical protein